MIVSDFESAPAEFVAVMVITFAPAIKKVFNDNCLVAVLKVNAEVDIPFTLTKICPADATFKTLSKP